MLIIQSHSKNVEVQSPYQLNFTLNVLKVSQFFFCYFRI